MALFFNIRFVSPSNPCRSSLFLLLKFSKCSSNHCTIFFFPHPFLYLCISDTQVIVAFWSTHWLNANLIFIVFILKHNLSQGNRTFFLNCLPATRAKELIAGVWEPGEEGLLRTNHGTGRKDGRVWAPHTRGHVLSPTGRVFQKHRLHPELSAFLPNRAYWRGVN